LSGRTQRAKPSVFCLSGGMHTRIQVVWQAIDCPQSLGAVEHDPKNARAHYVLGAFYIQVGKLSEAERHFRLALDADPDFSEPAHYLGKLKSVHEQSAE